MRVRVAGIGRQAEASAGRPRHLRNHLAGQVPKLTQCDLTVSLGLC